MPNCNFNGCFTGPYYPRQICTRSCTSCGANVNNGVVNPTVQNEWGFLTMEASAVAAGEALPLSLSMGSGTAITNNGSGANITAGVYEVQFNVQAEIPASGEVSVALFVGNDEVPTTRTVVQGAAGSRVSLSNSAMIAPVDNTTIRLVNTGVATNFFSANLTAGKLQ